MTARPPYERMLGRVAWAIVWTAAVLVLGTLAFSVLWWAP